MKNPNGYGGIRKLSGNRRRPFQVRITAGWKIENGKAKQAYKTLGYYASRAEALIALAEYNKNPFDIDKQKITFKEIYNILWERTYSNMGESSKRAYKLAFKNCSSLHNIKIKEIKKPQMQIIFDNLSDKSKPYQQSIKNLLSAVFKYALENDIVVKDYSNFVELTAVNKETTRAPFNQNEIKTLWDHIDFKLGNKGIKSIPFVDSIIFMCYTGVRVTEMFNIKKENVDLENNIIEIFGTKTKTSRRIVPIHKDILPLIEKRINENNSAYLFPGANEKKLNYSTYKMMLFIPILENFNIKHMPHDCRHTFATFAASSNMKELIVKRILGHTSNDITLDTYTHTINNDLIEEIQKFKIE